MVVCEVCGCGPEDLVTVYRQNPTGQKGVWRCAQHSRVPVALDVAGIVAAIEEDNERKEPRR